MKIQLASDLHFEHCIGRKAYDRILKGFRGQADVLVLAGDITSIRHLDSVRDLFGEFCDRYKDVVYVPGNHEYYGSDPETIRLILGAVKNEIHNFHILNNDIDIIDGQKFYGGTMWFPDLPGNGSIKDQLNDFLLIKNFEPWVYRQNENFRKFGEHVIDENTIVVSHHLPHPESIHPRYRTHIEPNLNRFFLSDESDLITRKQPKLWLHGHTHNSGGHYVGKTYVVCNPHGYPTENPREPRDLILSV